MEHQGIVSNVGNHDFFFVEDLETGEIFFCHAGFVQGEIFPKKGDKVSFEYLSRRVKGRCRPISALEVLG